MTTRRINNAVASRIPELERGIQNAIMEYMTWRGFFVINTSQRQRVDQGLAGITDIVAIRAGSVWFVEVKSETGKLRPSQAAFAARIKPHLGATIHHAVVRSVEEVERLIQEESNE